jgi:predicted choloylglycine hydrolase
LLVNLSSLREEAPGPVWRALFGAYWPYYREWFLSEGYLARPGYVTSSKKLRTHMPELVPIYERLVELAGGGDVAARFLSLYRPPPFLVGCSQAVWTGGEPILVRNYDYSSKLFEGTLLCTAWRRPVISMIDCLWGALDGVNDAGLAVSLAFGGKRLVGDGFGIPLILRYILEVCEDTQAATEALRAIPSHMPYNVTVVDRHGAFATAYLHPDRPTVVTDSRVCTNHQQRIEWEEFARESSTVERRGFLEARLRDPGETKAGFIRRFLRPPLYSARYERAFGTLYTVAYYPRGPTGEYYWPKGRRLRQSFSGFEERETDIHLEPDTRRGRYREGTSPQHQTTKKGVYDEHSNV